MSTSRKDTSKGYGDRNREENSRRRRRSDTSSEEEERHYNRRHRREEHSRRDYRRDQDRRHHRSRSRDRSEERNRSRRQGDSSYRRNDHDHEQRYDRCRRRNGSDPSRTPPSPAKDLDGTHAPTDKVTPQQDSAGVSIKFGATTVSKPIQLTEPVPAKYPSFKSIAASAPIARPTTVASVFNDDDDDEEEMPPEAKMRMKNVGRNTPTSAGPNSFGKTKMGFCNAVHLAGKDMEERQLGKK